MARPSLVLVLIVSLSTPLLYSQARRTPPPAPALRTPTGEKGLVELERQILEAIRERNIDKLEALLAPDFIYVSPRKRDLQRQEFINQVRSSTSEIEWLGAEEMKIRMYGDVAVVTGVQKSQVRSPKTGLQSSDAAFTNVFRRRQGRWELALAFIAEMPAAPVKK